MLQQIDSAHLAALESELARVTAQRDALRDAANRFLLYQKTPIDSDMSHESMAFFRLRAALAACQD